MNFFNHLVRAKKMISRGLIVLLLVPFLFFGTPKTAHAQWVVFDPANVVQTTLGAIWGGITSVATTINSALTGSLTAKEFIGDGIANFIAKMIIKQLTAQTVNWINSGFKGSPGFITNPDQFFLNIGDQTASKFLSGPVLSQLCTPFKAQVRIALVKNYLNETNPQYSCTIDRVIQNYDDFTRNFDSGGWDGWFSVTQNSTNNPIGSYLDAKNQMWVEIGRKSDTNKQQIAQGQGFLSFKRCPKGKTYGEIRAPGQDLGEGYVSTGYDPTDEGSENPDSDCSVEEETVTPGSVIQTQLNKALGSTFDGLNASDEINEIVGALATQLVSRIIGGIGAGLRGLTEKNSGEQRTFLEQMAATSPESIKENTDFQNGVDRTTPTALTQPVASQPTITLLGNNPLTIQTGTPFTDPGATATDAKDGDISVNIQVTEGINTSVAGTYTVGYSVKNSAGFPANPVTRTVYVVDQPGAPASNTFNPVRTTPSNPSGGTGGTTVTGGSATF